MERSLCCRMSGGKQNLVTHNAAVAQRVCCSGKPARHGIQSRLPSVFQHLSRDRIVL